MDDKRTLIAFLLVGLIFLLMPYYYELLGISQPAPEPESVSEALERDRARRADSLAAVAARQPARQEPAPGAVWDRESPTSPAQVAAAESSGGNGILPVGDERWIEIITPLQRLVFSTRGGVLTSVELQEYSKALGGPVELIPHGGYGLGLTLESETGRGPVLDLTKAYFEPDRELVRVDVDGEGQLRLRAVLSDGRVVTKTIRIRGDQYGAEVSVQLVGFSEDTVAELSWVGGIALAEREPELDLRAMKALAYVSESLEDVTVDEDESDSWSEKGDVGWAGVRNKYFFAALAPRSKARHRVQISGTPLVEAPFRKYDFALSTRWGDLAEPEWRLLLYAGPLDLEEIARYEIDFARAMDLGFPVIRDIAKVLLAVFVSFYQVIPNYGWVIVVFGFVVKLLVYPLTHKSYESASKMQELQPKMAALKEKYKNNNQKLSQETMKLYKEEGVNPLGGCLPLVFQMPIFIALYQVFSNAIQLRQTSWILWVTDLSLPDEIAVAGFELHVLPLLMATAMFFQSKMTMKDPKQAALVYLMPVVMVFIMWSFSSGLVLYWTVFNVLQIGQQHLTNHFKNKKLLAAA